MQNITITIKLRLYTTAAQDQLFRHMTQCYRQACNFVSQYIFDHDFELNSYRLHKQLYRQVRADFDLKSQLTGSVFRTATARYQTIRTQLLQNPYRYHDEQGQYHKIDKTLEWLYKPVYFSRPQADLVRDRDYSFVDGGRMLSINTLKKRERVRFAREHFAEYLDGSWSLGTAKLVSQNGIWYLHIPVTRAFEDFDKSAVKHVVGIDRGLRFLTTSYDEHGKTDFLSGKQILRKRHKFLEVRRQLQAKGTKSAKRALCRLAGRENRWMSDFNHCLSKTLVAKYGTDTLFVVEDLTGISFAEKNLSRGASANNDLRAWSFWQLEQYLAYKARMNRSEVLKVSARYTSQRCPKCGSIDKNNRHHEAHEYRCQCGYRSNDDRIGAMNIQLLGTWWISGEERPHFERITVSG